MIDTVRTALAMERKGLANVTTLDNTYYNNNKEMIDRFYVDKGKTNYDIPQIEIFEDIFSGSWNIAKSVASKYQASVFNRDRIPESFKPTDYINKANENHIKYADIANTLREEYRKKIEAEPSALQRYSASMMAETLRMVTDVRQMPALVGTAVLSPAVAGWIGASSTAAKISVNATLNTFENLIEDNVDTYMTENRFQTLEENIFSGLGGFGAGILFGGISEGAKALLRGVKQIDTNIKAKEIVKEAFDTATKKIDKETGQAEIIKLKKDMDNIKTTVDNIEEINEFKGRRGIKKDIIKKNQTFNGANGLEVDEKAYHIMNKIINDKSVPNVTDSKSFNKLMSDKEKYQKVLKEVYDRGNLTEKEKEAFEFFLNYYDKKTVNEVDMDVVNATKEIIETLDRPENKYSPVYEDGKVSVYRTSKDVYENRRKVKHNYKDYSKESLKNSLIKDGLIPEGAEDIKVNGRIPKTQIPIQSGIDADGKPVYTRSQWVRGDEDIDFEYTYKGKKYRGEITLTKENGYLGDIFVLDETSAPGTRVNETPIEKITNMVDDMNGMPKNVAPTSKAELNKIAYESTGLNKKYDYKKSIKEYMFDIEKQVGKIVRNKYDINSIEDFIDIFSLDYMLNYGRKIEYVGQKTMDSLGETRLIINADGEKVIQVALSDKIKDLDTQIGVLRHEFQHVKDLLENPDFESKAFDDVIKVKGDITIGELMNQIGKGHFAGFDDISFEVSYIVKNQIDNLVKDGKIDEEVLKVLKLEVPEKIETTDIKFMEEIIESTKQDPAEEQLAKLRYEFSKYKLFKDGINRNFDKAESTARASSYVGEWLETNLFIPFQKIKDQTTGLLVNILQVKDGKNILTANEIIEKFEQSGSVHGFTEYILRGKSSLPKELKYLEPELDRIRQQLRAEIDRLLTGTGIDYDDFVNNIIYDQSLSVEKYANKEELSKFLIDHKLDLDRFLRGEKVFDNATKMNIPKRLLDIAVRFADDKYDKFYSANERLIKTLDNALENDVELSPTKLKSLLEDAKYCLTKQEKIDLVKKYNLESSRILKEYLDTSDFYVDVKEDKIAANIVKSRKDNARFFYSRDMMSKRGNNKDNKFLGTHVNRFGRFNYFTDEEFIISKDSLNKLIDEIRTSDRTSIGKLLRNVSSSRAMKETLPNGSINTVLRLLDLSQEYSSNPDFQTYSRDIVGRIDEMIGEHLGRVTKPARTLIDNWVISFLHWTNSINLTGPKAIKDMAFETPTMARARVMLYGGKGFLDTYAHFVKTIELLKLNKEVFDKFDKAMGGRFESSVPIRFLNSLYDELDDFTGEKAERIARYGSKFDKVTASIDKGLNKLNWYGQTQKVMKYAAYFMGSETLLDLGKAKNLDDLFSKNTAYLKRLFKDLEITDLDYMFIKELSSIDDLRNHGIFSEADIFDWLTRENIESKVGEKLTDEHFNLLRNNISQKITKLYDKIVNDISPTEANPSMRYNIEMIRNPIHRNFMRLMGNFKSSVNEQWRRLGRDIYLSNVGSDGFDWSNKIWQKRMFKSMSQATLAYLTGATVIAGLNPLDSDTYADPIGSIEEKIDDLIDNPGSHLWEFLDSYFNSWALINGASTIRRPISITKNIFKGDLEEAGMQMLKFGLGSSNFNNLQAVGETAEDIVNW